jgi:hypothetical protein
MIGEGGQVNGVEGCGEVDEVEEEEWEDMEGKEKTEEEVEDVGLWQREGRLRWRLKSEKLGMWMRRCERIIAGYCKSSVCGIEGRSTYWKKRLNVYNKITYLSRVTLLLISPSLRRCDVVETLERWERWDSWYTVDNPLVGEWEKWDRMARKEIIDIDLILKETKKWHRINKTMPVNSFFL